MSSRISLIHATPLAIEPISDAFKRLWPDATTFNLLEDSLTADLRAAGGHIHAMSPRFVRLAQYAVNCGANAVLFTCSAFGPAIEQARAAVAVPVLKPNEAMIEEAVGLGARIALIATFEPSLAPIRKEFEEHAASQGKTLMLDSMLAEGAWDAIRSGDEARHDRLIAETCARAKHCDVVCFAQFSMTGAQRAASDAAGKPTLTTPDSAVRKLRSLVSYGR
jgi:Asp/Glu/hydantoin racemase